MRRRSDETLPIRIDRRRVYVLPTRFGLAYMLLVGTMGLGALNYNNNPAFLLALLLGTAGLASLVFAHLQLSGLRMESLAADPVHAGDPLDLRIALVADDPRPRQGLRVVADGVVAVADVPAGRAGIARIAVPTTHRGWFDAGRVELATTRPLGLALAWSWLFPARGWLVYPRPERDGPPLPDAPAAGARTRPSVAGDDIHQIRPYRAGDPMRAIAWKASARSTHLLSREYEQPVDADVRLDWTRVRTLEHEAAISRLTHWVELAERLGRRYALQLPGQPVLGPARGPEHLHACLDALARMPEAPR